MRYIHEILTHPTLGIVVAVTLAIIVFGLPALAKRFRLGRYLLTIYGLIALGMFVGFELSEEQIIHVQGQRLTEGRGLANQLRAVEAQLDERETRIARLEEELEEKGGNIRRLSEQVQRLVIERNETEQRLQTLLNNPQSQLPGAMSNDAPSNNSTSNNSASNNNAPRSSVDPGSPLPQGRLNVQQTFPTHAEGVTLTLSAIDFQEDRMRWHFDLDNRSSRDWQTNFDFERSFFSDVQGNVYERLGSNYPGDAPLPAGQRQSYWFDFSLPFNNARHYEFRFFSPRSDGYVTFPINRVHLNF